MSGTGTAKRNEFNRMLADCETGKIDIILVKSISRFARNTVDLLETIRHLKDIGVEVRFEREHISSFSGDGEPMLTILASFAQEESRSISDNVKWGIPNGHFRIPGYRWKGDELVIMPEKAAIVRRIFHPELSGWKILAGNRGTEEFDVSSFSKRIENIVVIGKDTIELHFYGGEIKAVKCKSDAKKPMWTPELKALWSEYNYLGGRNGTGMGFNEWKERGCKWQEK